MRQYETELSSPPGQGGQRRLPLAAVMLIDLLLVMIAILILSTLVLGVLAMTRGIQQGLNLSTLDQEQVLQLVGAEGVFVVLLLQNAIFVGVPIMRVAWLRRTSLATIGFQATQPLRLIAIGVALGFAVLVGNILIGLLFFSLGIQQNQAEQYPLFPSDYAGQALFFIAAAVLAPIGEEVLFRGYVFNAIRQSLGSTSIGMPLAYLASALSFMIVHVLSATEGLIALLVPAFLMGLLLAWGMHRTGSLIPPIIAHMINNSVALIGLLIAINNPELVPGMP